MKLLTILLFAFLATQSFAQAIDSASVIDKNQKHADFVVYFDKGKATKDGFYLNGYVVNIPYKRVSDLHGKKIRVKGKVTIVKGLSNDPSEPISQGRAVDTKYIKKPSITIIVEK